MNFWQTSRDTALALLGRASPPGRTARTVRDGLGDGGIQQRADLAANAAQSEPREADAEAMAPLAAAPDQLPSPTPAPERGTPAGRKFSVLLIEANRTNQQVIGRVLVRAGYDFMAVDRAAAAVATDARFDIVLADLGTAGGQDVTAAQILQTALPGRPRAAILALAPDQNAEFRARCKGAGFRDLICKPVRPAALIEALAAVVVAQETEQFSAVNAEDADLGAVPSSRTPAIDQATLDSLERLGGADFVDELASQFMVDAATTLAELATAVETADVQAFREHAHALRSAAANIGALGMYEICLTWREIEPPALSEHGKLIVVGLMNEFERVRATLKQVQTARLQRAAS